MELNASQKLGLETLKKFLNDSSAQEIILQGEAGTGKTFLVAKLLDDFNNKKFPTKVSSFHVSAMTNKAVGAIAEALIKHKVDTNTFTISTTHSALSLTIKFDPSVKRNVIIQTTKNRKIYESFNNVIIIDEASMIDEAIHFFIQKFLNIKSNKVIYCCDEYQLKSVDEYPNSPIYNKENNIERITLTENVRQKNSPLLYETCKQLRKTVESLKFNHVQVNPKIHWVNKNSDAFHQIIAKMFKPESTNNRILAYSNEQTNYYNNTVRKIKNLPLTPLQGDSLICNGTVEIALPNTTKKPVIYNESIVTLLSIIEDDVEIVAHNKQKVILPVYVCDIVTEDLVEFRNVYAIKDLNKYKKAKKFIFNNNLSNYYSFIMGVLDLRFTYASTVHKAQGSTFNNVLVDLDDFNRPFVLTDDMLSRLLYVAFSRASNNVILTGSLNYKHGSVIL